MAKDVEQLLENVKTYLKRLEKECKLPANLETSRAELLDKINVFLDKKGIIASPKNRLYTTNDDEDNQSLCSTATQSTTVSSTSDGNDQNIPPVPAATLSTAMQTGYLFKKRKQEKISKVLGPQKRWCAIKDGTFYYFDSEKAQKQKGAFSLADYEAYSIGNEESSCAFNMTCPGQRSYTFSADSNRLMKDWVCMINSVYNKGAINNSPAASPVKKGKLPIPPPRGLSATQISENDEVCNSIESYVVTEPPIPIRRIGANKHESVISTGTVYEDTDEMELQDNIQPPNIPTRINSKPRSSTESDVYEDTDEVLAKIAERGYMNNVVDDQKQLHSDSGDEEVYEDTDDLAGVNNNNKPACANENSGGTTLSSLDQRSPIPKSANFRNTIHPPPCKDSNSGPNENLSQLYYALYDCSSKEPGDLVFSAGDIISILDRDSENWWTGQVGGKIGLVPHNYLNEVYRPKTTK